MLVRLLYASRAASPITTDLVDSILSESRGRNPDLGVTGILCYSADHFMQVLEGGRREVSSLYNSIVRDRRHLDVQLLLFEEIAERRFSSWTMGQVNLAKVNPATLIKYSEKPVLDPFSIAGSVSLALLEELIATAAIVGRSA
jgi:hypothetical protein